MDDVELASSDFSYAVYRALLLEAVTRSVEQIDYFEERDYLEHIRREQETYENKYNYDVNSHKNEDIIYVFEKYAGDDLYRSFDFATNYIDSTNNPWDDYNRKSNTNYFAQFKLFCNWGFSKIKSIFFRRDKKNCIYFTKITRIILASAAVFCFIKIFKINKPRVPHLKNRANFEVLLRKIDGTAMDYFICD